MKNRFNPPQDPDDWQSDQFRAVVQGIYESAVEKRLGVPFLDSKGRRADVKAVRSGELTRKDIDQMVSRAFAIATKQGQKHGYLKKGTQKATTKGRALAAARAGADPKLIERQLKSAGYKGDRLSAIMELVRKHAQKAKSYHSRNMADYEMTLALRRKGSKVKPQSAPRKKVKGKTKKRRAARKSGYVQTSQDGRTIYRFPDGKWFYREDKAKAYAKKIA